MKDLKSLLYVALRLFHPYRSALNIINVSDKSSTIFYEQIAKLIRAHSAAI